MLKIKKHCFILLACISIFLSITVNSINLEVTAILYMQEQSLFTDVDVNASYYGDLKFLVDLDIIQGFPGGFFYPDRSVSRAEFIKMLVIAAGYAVIDIEESVNIFKDVAGHWGEAYINTAVINKIIDAGQYENFSPDKPVTRHEMAVFMINALDIYLYEADSLYSDTDDNYINVASGEYLLFGYNENGRKIFRPHENLIRADVCRVIARTVQYRGDTEFYKNKMILEFIKNDTITTEKQFYDLLNACTTYFIDVIDLNIMLSEKKIENSFNTYIAINPENPTIRSIYYESNNFLFYNIRLTFNYDLLKTEEERRIKEIEKIADTFISQYIRQDMTDVEKITEIHKYLVLNCEYDERFRNVNTDNFVVDIEIIDSFTAYGALVNKVAVCQGNSAAFNILAKKSGIKSSAVSGTPPNSSVNHMWNMVSVDGTIYFIDTTWDEPVKGEDGAYETKHLLRTEQEFQDFGYKWNPEFTNKKYLNK